MSRLHKAARTTVVAQAFNWASLLLSLATVPLYLQWLGEERYGVMLTGLAFAGYLMFSDAGLSWASMLLISQAHGRDDRAGIASIVRNSFSLAGCSAALVAVVIAGLLWGLAHVQHLTWLPQHPESGGILLAVGSSVVCSLGLSPFYNLLIGIQEAHLAAFYQGIGRLLGTLGAVGAAASGSHLGWVVGANAAGALLAGALAVRACWQRFPWAFQSGAWWQPAQIRQQLRTGGKSFAMQIGNVLFGTAPVLAISSGAGPQFVPYFSIPMTLLNAPLSVLTSFNASLQPGYGEAIGRNEKAWVAETVRRILRQVLVMLGLLGCGFLLLAAPFARLWTGGRIELTPPMLASVLGIAALGTLLGVFRYAITGINRHRLAAVSDLACGIFAMALAAAAVRQSGYASVGLGIGIAAGLTSAWILPRELKRALDGKTLWPAFGFWLRWMGLVATSFGAGWLALRGFGPAPGWLGVLATGCAIGGVFLPLAWGLLPAETVHLRALGARFVPALR